MKTLTAFCDLKYCPVSYDFSTFLVRAMLERDRSGCDALHVVLVPNEGGLGGFSRHWGEHDEAATRWRLWHIVMPLCQLAGATVTLAPSAEWCSYPERFDLDSTYQQWWPKGKAHFAGPLIEAARAGEKIPKLLASDAARRYVDQWFSGNDKKIITLTTRSQTTDPARNTNTAEWYKLESYLFGLGYDVIPLIDSNDALKRRNGNWAQICPDMRLAIYERADMNIIGNNGPCNLLHYSDAAYLVFNYGLPREQWSEYVRDHLKLQYGEQLPWANWNQNLVWQADSFDIMKAEFKDWERRSSVMATK